MHPSDFTVNYVRKQNKKRTQQNIDFFRRKDCLLSRYYMYSNIGDNHTTNKQWTIYHQTMPSTPDMRMKMRIFIEPEIKPNRNGAYSRCWVGMSKTIVIVSLHWLVVYCNRFLRMKTKKKQTSFHSPALLWAWNCESCELWLVTIFILKFKLLECTQHPTHTNL